MASILKHLRSSTADKRPTASGLADGQIALNTASGTPAMFFKDSAGNIVKVGPAHIGTTAPNASPAGSAGNSDGELWIDESLTTRGLKYYDGATFINLTPSGTTSTVGLVELATDAETQAGTDNVRAVTPSGLQSKISDSTATTSSTTIASSTAVKSAFDLANAALPKAGGTLTGELLISPSGSLVFEGSSDDSFETTIAVTNPTADRTITFPNVTGNVVTTGDSGTVTSTMIADGTIVDADINASAAIAGTKISPDFGSQTITTTGVVSAALGAAATPSLTFTGDLNTGIYSPGADQVAISTGGSGRLFVNSSGQVGIGGVPSGSNLNIIDPVPVIRLTDSDTSGYSHVLQSDTSLYLDADRGAAGTGALIVRTNGTNERLRITSAGLVGVGTSTPGAKLDVTESANVSLEQYLNARGGNGLSSQIRFFTKSAGGGNTGGAIGHSDALGGLILSGSSTSISGAQDVVITSAGRVGIGTSSPGSLLHLNSGASDLFVRMEARGANALESSFLLLTKNSAGTNTGGSIGHDGNTNTLYLTGDTSGGATQHISIDSTGRLGIGTSTPNCQLTNTGTTSLGTNNWPTSTVARSGGRALIGSGGVLLNWNETAGAGNAAEFYLGTATGAGAATMGYARLKGGTENGTNSASFFSIETSNTTGTPSTALYINSSKQVGIGTTGPGRKLAVTDDSGADTALALTCSANTRSFIQYASSATNVYAGNDGGSFVVWPGASEKLRVDTSGRLLVGTSSDISGGETNAVVQAANSNGGVIVTGRTDTTVTSGEVIGGIDFSTQTGASSTWQRSARILCFADADQGNGDSPGRLTFSTTADGASSPTERMRIDSSGRVGIGTTSPGHDIDLRKDAAGSTVTLRVRNDNAAADSNSALVLDTPNGVWGLRALRSGARLAVDIGGSEKAAIDTSGRLLVGTTTARANFSNSTLSPYFQIEGANSNANRLQSFTYGLAGVDGPVFAFAKHRSNSVGGTTVVAADDQLGWVSFQGSDGTEFVESASIRAFVDGTPGANDMPGRLVFSTTADGASSPTERMRITNDGDIRWATPTTTDNRLVNDGRILSKGTYDNTTASGANMFVSGAYLFFRSTSSARYKTNIETIEDSYADAILNCRPVWYQSLCTSDNPDWGHWGFIAEEVEKIDPRLCHYGTDEDGNQQVESVQYDRFVPHLLNLIKRQKEQIEALEARLTAAGI